MKKRTKKRTKTNIHWICDAHKQSKQGEFGCDEPEHCFTALENRIMAAEYQDER